MHTCRYATFLPQAVQSLFSLSASSASYVVGLVIIPGAAGGIFIGGWYTGRVVAASGLKGLIKFCVGVSVVTLCLFFGMYIGCANPNVAGVSNDYTSQSLPVILNLSTPGNGKCDAASLHVLY